MNEFDYSGIPRARLKWWRGSDLLHSSSEPSAEELSSTVDGDLSAASMLTIDRLTRGYLDSEFMCEASNNNITQPPSSTVRLDLNRKFKFQPVEDNSVERPVQFQTVLPFYLLFYGRFYGVLHIFHYDGCWKLHTSCNSSFLSQACVFEWGNLSTELQISIVVLHVLTFVLQVIPIYFILGCNSYTFYGRFYKVLHMLLRNCALYKSCNKSYDWLCKLLIVAAVLLISLVHLHVLTVVLQV